MVKDLFFNRLVTKDMQPVHGDERFFEGYLTVQIKDKQGEITVVDELYKVLPIWMDRGAPISDTHSNRIIGKGINYSKDIYKDKDGEEYPAIKITGKIHKDYELDNEIWKKIKSGEYKGLSFGGATKSDRDPVRMKDGSIAYSLKDLEHYEVAVCADPAVPLALITDYNPVAKSATNAEVREDGKMVIKCDKFGCYITKPIPDGKGGKGDFDHCEEKNQDKNDPAAFCGAIQHKLEKAIEAGMIQQVAKNGLEIFLTKEELNKVCSGCGKTLGEHGIVKYDHSNSMGDQHSMYNQNTGRETWVGQGLPQPTVEGKDDHPAERGLTINGDARQNSKKKDGSKKCPMCEKELKLVHGRDDVYECTSPDCPSNRMGEALSSGKKKKGRTARNRKRRKQEIVDAEIGSLVNQSFVSIIEKKILRGGERIPPPPKKRNRKEQLEHDKKEQEYWAEGFKELRDEEANKSFITIVKARDSDDSEDVTPIKGRDDNQQASDYKCGVGGCGADAVTFAMQGKQDAEGKKTYRKDPKTGKIITTPLCRNCAEKLQRGALNRGVTVHHDYEEEEKDVGKSFESIFKDEAERRERQGEKERKRNQNIFGDFSGDPDKMTPTPEQIANKKRREAKEAEILARKKLKRGKKKKSLESLFKEVKDGKFTGSWYSDTPSTMEGTTPKNRKITNTDGTGDFGHGRGTSYTAYMTPKEFLNLTPQQGKKRMGNISDNPKDFYGSKDRSDKEGHRLKDPRRKRMGKPTLWVDHKTGEVKEHEGRHRARAFMDHAPNTALPVDIAPQDKHEDAKHIMPKDLKGQRNSPDYWKNRRETPEHQKQNESDNKYMREHKRKKRAQEKENRKRNRIREGMSSLKSFELFKDSVDGKQSPTRKPTSGQSTRQGRGISPQRFQGQSADARTLDIPNTTSGFNQRKREQRQLGDVTIPSIERKLQDEKTGRTQAGRSRAPRPQGGQRANREVKPRKSKPKKWRGREGEKLTLGNQKRTDQPIPPKVNPTPTEHMKKPSKYTKEEWDKLPQFFKERDFQGQSDELKELQRKVDILSQPNKYPYKEKRPAETKEEWEKIDDAAQSERAKEIEDRAARGIQYGKSFGFISKKKPQKMRATVGWKQFIEDSLKDPKVPKEWKAGLGRNRKLFEHLEGNEPTSADTTTMEDSTPKEPNQLGRIDPSKPMTKKDPNIFWGSKDDLDDTEDDDSTETAIGNTQQNKRIFSGLKEKAEKVTPEEKLLRHPISGAEGGAWEEESGETGYCPHCFPSEIQDKAGIDPKDHIRVLHDKFPDQTHAAMRANYAKRPNVEFPSKFDRKENTEKLREEESRKRINQIHDDYLRDQKKPKKVERKTFHDKAEESNFGAGQRGLGYGNEGHTNVQGSGQSHTITEIPPEMEVIVHDVNEIKESKKEGYTTEAGNSKRGDPSRATDDDDSLLSPKIKRIHEETGEDEICDNCGHFDEECTCKSATYAKKDYGRWLSPKKPKDEADDDDYFDSVNSDDESSSNSLASNFDEPW